VQTLKKRRDFINIANSGIKWVTPAFVIQMGCDFLCDEPVVGYAATRKIGGAVQRNRTKRRMRALVAEQLSTQGRKNCGYVLIARKDLISKKYAELQADMKWALKRIHQQWDEVHENSV
jgi:ribonuclease P protein component